MSSSVLRSLNAKNRISITHAIIRHVISTQTHWFGKMITFNEIILAIYEIFLLIFNVLNFTFKSYFFLLFLNWIDLSQIY